LRSLFDRALLARALSAAVALDVFTLLDGRALAADELAKEAGAQAHALGDALEALALEGFLGRDGQGRFTLAPLGAPLSRRSGDWRGAIAFREAEEARQAVSLVDALRSGSPPPAAPREPQALVAEVLARHQAGSDTASALAALLPLGGKGRVIALGGAPGTLLPPLLARRADATALLLDHPIALDVARKLLPREEVKSGRVKLKAGDVKDDMPPAGFDLALVDGVATRLAPVEVRRVLQRAHTALVEGGTLAVVDRVRCKAPAAVAASDAGLSTPDAPAGRASATAAAQRDSLASLRLLLTAPGAALHERADLERWALEAGFQGLRWTATPLDPEHAVLLGEKSTSPAITHAPPPAE